MARSSGTYPIPRRAISYAFRPSSSSPLKRTLPVAFTCPITAFTVVERPTPLRPRRLTISPGPTRKRTPWRTWLFP